MYGVCVLVYLITLAVVVGCCEVWAPDVVGMVFCRASNQLISARVSSATAVPLPLSAFPSLLLCFLGLPETLPGGLVSGDRGFSLAYMRLCFSRASLVFSRALWQFSLCSCLSLSHNTGIIVVTPLSGYRPAHLSACCALSLITLSSYSLCLSLNFSMSSSKLRSTCLGVWCFSCCR